MVAAGNSRKELDTMKSRIILNRERTAKAQEISIPRHGKGGELGIKAVTGLVGLIETLKDCGTCQEVQSVFDAICGYNACCIRCEFIDEKGADELMELVKGILAETPAEGQTVKSAAPAYADLIAAEAALPQAYENGAVWCMSKKTFMSYYGLTDTNGQPIGRVNYGIAGKPERTLLGRAVVCCDYVKSYDKSLAAGTKFGFLFNFKDYVLNTNYAMGVKKYEDNETDDQVTKGIMLVDGKVVDKNSLVVLEKIQSV